MLPSLYNAAGLTSPALYRRGFTLSNARRLMVLGLALMMALALAAPALAQGAGQAQVRVAHLAPDAPNVDVYVNDEPVLTDVPYTTISDYLSLPAECLRRGHSLR